VMLFINIYQVVWQNQDDFAANVYREAS